MQICTAEKTVAMSDSENSDRATEVMKAMIPVTRSIVAMKPTAPMTRTTEVQSVVSRLGRPCVYDEQEHASFYSPVVTRLGRPCVHGERAHASVQHSPWQIAFRSNSVVRPSDFGDSFGQFHVVHDFLYIPTSSVESVWLASTVIRILTCSTVFGRI